MQCQNEVQVTMGHGYTRANSISVALATDGSEWVSHLLEGVGIRMEEAAFITFVDGHSIMIWKLICGEMIDTTFLICEIKKNLSSVTQERLYNRVGTSIMLREYS